MLRFLTKFAVVLLTTAVVLLTPARASAQITILGAQPDQSANVLTLTGSGFGPGLRVFLFVNGVSELPVLSQTASQVRATLPFPISPGTYLLFVYLPSNGQYAAFDATVPGGGARLMDVTGRFIGYVVGPDRVSMRIGAESFNISVLAAGFPFSGDSLRYLDAACSVGPYTFHVVPTERHIIEDGRVTGLPFGNVAWVPDYSLPPVTAGHIIYGKTGGMCFETSVADDTLLQPNKSISLSAFTPPFGVQVQ